MMLGYFGFAVCQIKSPLAKGTILSAQQNHHFQLRFSGKNHHFPILHRDHHFATEGSTYHFATKEQP